MLKPTIKAGKTVLLMTDYFILICFLNRLPTLITSLIYLILNSYSIALLVVWLDSLESDTTSPDYDPSDQSTLIVFIGTALRSWCALSASVAACGSLGAFIVSIRLSPGLLSFFDFDIPICCHRSSTSDIKSRRL
jgi:hypothetical protein